MYKCKVIDIINEGNIKHIVLNKPHNFSYDAGQFIMIKINDEIPKKAFSLSSSPSEKDLMITVKLNNEGIFTPYIFNDLKINDEIIIEGAYGKMSFNKINEKEKNISLICAGTGVAPMRSIFKFILDNKLNNETDIYYVTKTFENILFKKDFDLLNKNLTNNKQNFNVNIYLSQEKKENYFHGRIDKEKIKFDKDVYFICGPKDFVIETTKFLKEKNIKDIRIEAW